jgi:hypothetical protein
LLGSLTRSNRIFTWTGVTLSSGENKIEAVGYKNGVAYRDSCTWSYSPSLNRVKINFQPVTVPVPDGYLADYGAIYGPRGNGLTYGWSLNNRRNTRDRNSLTSPSQQYDTFIHMQLNGSYSWEIAVPNGDYAVHVGAGDPVYFDSKYAIAVEGALVVDGTPADSQHWVEGMKTVTVSDGRLTINTATGAVNNKICFIEITPVTGHTIPAADESILTGQMP